MYPKLSDSEEKDQMLQSTKIVTRCPSKVKQAITVVKLFTRPTFPALTDRALTQLVVGLLMTRRNWKKRNKNQLTT